MITHGDTIRLLAQKNPSFQRTPGGGFDTGTRRFKCLTSEYLRFLRRVFVPGANDFAILRGIAATSGAAFTGHRQMFVSHADIEQQDSATTCVLRVEYQGLLAPKPGAIRFSTSTTEQSTVPSFGALTIITATRFDAPVPTALHRYVSTTGRPSMVEPGRQAEPPGITPEEKKQVRQYYASVMPSTVVLFEGWVLQTRTAQAPGGVTDCALWETDDTYQFVRKTAEVSL